MSNFKVGDRVINKATGVKGIVDKVEYFIAIDNYQAFMLGTGENWELFSESVAHKLATAVEALERIMMTSQDARGLMRCLCHSTAHAALEKINKKESKDDQV